MNIFETSVDFREIVRRLKEIRYPTDITTTEKAFAVVLLSRYQKMQERASRYNIGVPLVCSREALQHSFELISSFAEYAAFDKTEPCKDAWEYVTAIRYLIDSYVYLEKLLAVSGRAFLELSDDKETYRPDDSLEMDDEILSYAETELISWAEEHWETMDYRTGYLLTVAVECLVLIPEIRQLLARGREKDVREKGHKREYFRMTLTPEDIWCRDEEDRVHRWREVKQIFRIGIGFPVRPVLENLKNIYSVELSRLEKIMSCYQEEISGMNREEREQENWNSYFLGIVLRTMMRANMAGDWRDDMPVREIYDACLNHERNKYSEIHAGGTFGNFPASFTVCGRMPPYNLDAYKFTGNHFYYFLGESGGMHHILLAREEAHWLEMGERGIRVSEDQIELISWCSVFEDLISRSPWEGADYPADDSEVYALLVQNFRNTAKEDFIEYSEIPMQGLYRFGIEPESGLPDVRPCYMGPDAVKCYEEELPF